MDAGSRCKSESKSRRHFATTNGGSSLLSVINDKTDEQQNNKTRMGRDTKEWEGMRGDAKGCEGMLRMPHKLDSTCLLLAAQPKPLASSMTFMGLLLPAEYKIKRRRRRGVRGGQAVDMPECHSASALHCLSSVCGRMISALIWPND